MANETPAPQQPNHIDSIIKEVRKPELTIVEGRPAVLLPDGYKLQMMETLLPDPPRKLGTIKLTDCDSFVHFVKREGSLATCQIYADVDTTLGKVSFTAILNDHEQEKPHWRDYRAVYTPTKSVEWQTWMKYDGSNMSQADFGAFLEENVKDIVAISDSPAGAQMLAMALDFEAKQDITIKSALRLESGSVAFNYVDKEDDATTKRMEVFRRFTIGIAPFMNGQGYQLSARLKYKHPGGKLSFWYELIRPDLVLQHATSDLVRIIAEKSGFPVFYAQL